MPLPTELGFAAFTLLTALILVGFGKEARDEPDVTAVLAVVAAAFV